MTILDSTLGQVGELGGSEEPPLSIIAFHSLHITSHPSSVQPATAACNNVLLPMWGDCSSPPGLK